MEDEPTDIQPLPCDKALGLGECSVCEKARPFYRVLKDSTVLHNPTEGVTS